MSAVSEIQIVTGAWVDILSDFVSATRMELLIASPWITVPAARLISQRLVSGGSISLQILARMDESDFLSGSSDVLAFRQQTYPTHVKVAFRALSMLHGKMLVADQQRIILGSANLTEGGLFRNHEVSLLVDSHDIGRACRGEFFRLWSIATAVPDGYLDGIESTLAETLPDTDDTISTQATARRRPSRKRVWSTGTRYVSPPKAKAARSLIAQTLQLPLPADLAHETRDDALEWLERSLKFVALDNRRSPAIVHRLERLMYHPDSGVRSTALDRAGRSGNRLFLPRLQAIATNVTEPPEVRNAATFSLGLLGSPEAFGTLASLLQETGDTGRWARRGCFLLINDVDRDGQLSVLAELGVKEPMAVLGMAKASEVGHGSVAERLTKALILEQYAMGRWSQEQVTCLACVIALMASAVAVAGRQLRLPPLVRKAAEALGVERGDLRHGPLSPSLLRRISQYGQTDLGFGFLLGDAWVNVQHSTPSARKTLASQPGFSAFLQALDETGFGSP